MMTPNCWKRNYKRKEKHCKTVKIIDQTIFYYCIYILSMTITHINLVASWELLEKTMNNIIVEPKQLKSWVFISTCKFSFLLNKMCS